MSQDPKLPIDDVLPGLASALAAGTAAVLVAPPGAGKTTRVPLALLDEPWTGDRRILLLEPRRLAARAAADRMARTLGEAVGGTVGLRARFDTAVSARTRIEVVTEGVFTRIVLDDPELDGVAAVIFDEYHERSLDADLGLALALDVQGALRPDLRILVMSATLDGARVARLLGDASVIESQGRAFPVETRWIGRDPDRRIEEAMADAVLAALRAEHGSVLAFLPGQGEILRTANLLAAKLRPGEAEVAPLYGALDRAAQDRAVRPAPDGSRKIVLATGIAESSLTIEGVRVVVDSGLARVPRYEPDLGLTRLETERASRASADQRRGRAGRTEPGICYRLWAEAAEGALQPFSRPEILDADLTGLVLDLATWGARDPAALQWLDPPPAPAVTEARRTLEAIGALDAEGGVKDEGRSIARIAAPPRVARMVIEAARRGAAGLGAEIAVLLGERGLGGAGTDLADRLARWRRDQSARAVAARSLARSFVRAAQTPGDAGEPDLSIGSVLALAFPDRIAKARGQTGAFLLANGRAASLEPHDPLARSPFLAVAELAGRAARSRILLAAALDAADVEAVAGNAIRTSDELAFDPARAALSARRVTRLGALVLAEAPLPVPADETAARVLAESLVRIGLDRLPWSKAAVQLRDRIGFLREAEGDGGSWPDLGDAALRKSVADWLAPFLLGKAALKDISTDDLDQALDARLDRGLRRRLDVEAPTHFEAPTGTRAAVDYAAEGGPAVALRVQELYGLAVHPALAGGRVPLVLHLLSPAHRPIQVTRDLPGFWRGSWAAVRSEMRGRYPRHLWPDDPAAAAPTTHAKPRGT